ncbi:MAG: hypothetical protein FWF59_09790 [Turicibacter sp.]|nr:hypothetical protein [Turicibacter sp.]
MQRKSQDCNAYFMGIILALVFWLVNRSIGSLALGFALGASCGINPMDWLGKIKGGFK